MNYRVPDKPADPKQRFVVITDQLEIESIQRNGLRDIIGYGHQDSSGAITWYGESNSVDQFRGKPVEFNP